MIVPYPKPSDPLNINFNYLHSRGRVKIENAIGLWKGIFKIAGTTVRIKCYHKIVSVLKPTIAVHNFIIRFNKANTLIDDNEEDLFPNDHEEVERFEQHRAIERYSQSVNSFDRRERMKTRNE